MLTKRSIQVTVLSWHESRHPEMPAEVEILPVPKPAIPFPKIGELTTIYRIRRLFEKYRPDIVHVHYVANEAWYCAMARMQPLVATCWGSDIHSTTEVGLSPKRVRKVLRTACLVTADSEAVLEEADHLAGGLNSKMLWRIGVDMEKFRPGLNTDSFRERMGLQPGQRLILSPRAMRPFMNNHLALEAFSSIADEFPTSVLGLKTYSMAFHSEAYLHEIRDRISELSLGKRIIFLPDVNQTEMPLLYNLADVVVNIPSRDGMPMTLFEAMGCGRVCVVSKIEAYREFATRNPCPVIPVNLDIGSIADGIACALRQEEFPQISTQARRFALQLGDEAAETDRLINAYHNIKNGTK
jgi:glycosyltransferase involved in cell wall biosynthesis